MQYTFQPASRKQEAAVGFKEVEVGPDVKPGALNADLRAAGLTVPSGYFDEPKDLDEWKKEVPP